MEGKKANKPRVRFFLVFCCLLCEARHLEILKEATKTWCVESARLNAGQMD